MQRRQLLRFTASGMAAVCVPALAQKQARVRRIGWLAGSNVKGNASYLDAFRRGMLELSWVEGRDYGIDARYADNAPERVGVLAAELVASKPELLLAVGASTIRALAQRTHTIPIVFGIAPDPVANGFARSLRRPGANLTGITNLSRELAPKRLELIRAALPGMAHLALLFNPANAASFAEMKEIEQVAAQLRLRVTRIELRQAADIAPAFKRAVALGINAYMNSQSAFFVTHSRTIADVAVKLKLPGIATTDLLVEAGALMSYGPSNDDNFRRAASYVDRIFKGAKPGDLPIQQPTMFELVVNMKTARAIGLTVPESILLRADRIIE